MHQPLQPDPESIPLKDSALPSAAVRTPEAYSFAGLNPAFKANLIEFANREIPRHILNVNSAHEFQMDRDIKENLMYRLLTKPDEVVIASAHHRYDYVYILKSDDLFAGRAGVIFTQMECEPPVPGGYWMDIWEPAHGIPEAEYRALSIEQRAAHEASLQLSYVEEQYHGRKLMFWYPNAYEQWQLTHGPSNPDPIEWQPALARRLIAQAESSENAS